MEDDEHSFNVEWHIENISCWNKEIHSPGISTEGFRIGELIFDLTLYPKGLSGNERYVVLQMYDESASHGIVQFFSSDKSIIYGSLRVTPVRVGGIMIMRSRIEFATIFDTFKDDPCHEDDLILLYFGTHRRPLYRFESMFLKSRINAFDSSCVIPGDKIFQSLSRDLNLADISSLQDGEIGHFKLSVRFDYDRDVFFLLSLIPEQIVDRTLVHCFIYLVRYGNLVIDCVPKTHIFEIDNDFSICLLYETQELKGSSLIVRLKIVSDDRVYTEGIIQY